MGLGSSLGKIVKTGARVAAAYYTGGASEAALAAAKAGKAAPGVTPDAPAPSTMQGTGTNGDATVGAGGKIGGKKGMRQQLLSEGLRYMSNR